MNLLNLIFLVALVGLPASLRAESSGGHATGNLPAYRVEDPDSAGVSEKNLLANDRFWPYQVALTSALPAGEGSRPLDAGSVGVLIRVEASGRARIDFGRDGAQLVPVAKTDLVERANRIRRGELEKLAPNLLLAIGPRLVDSASDTLRPLPFPEVAARRGLLCVFADPDSKDLAALATALAPLNERDDVFTIFFPQGADSDAEVRERLRSLKWTVPFLYDHLAEAYTDSLIERQAGLPVVLLQTMEGRVLFQSRWKGGVASALRAALDAALANASPQTALGVVRE